MNGGVANHRLFMIGERESAFFVRSCPWGLLLSPAVREVADLYWWREVGGVQWNSVPARTREAVGAYARGVAAATDKKYRDDAARRNKG